MKGGIFIKQADEKEYLKMAKEYISLHDSGYSLNEIADRFHITPAGLRYRLDGIAKAIGRSRDDLLDQPHRAHVVTVKTRAEAKRTN